MAAETTAATPSISGSPDISETKPEATETTIAPLAVFPLPPNKVEASGASSETPAVVTTESKNGEAKEPAIMPHTPEKKVDFAADTVEKATLESPLSKLFAVLPATIAEAQYYEMWGVELAGPSHIPTSIVLEKFLRANGKDVDKARVQLTEALKWRLSTNPSRLLRDIRFDSTKFGGLGFVTVYPKTESHEKEIVTWNIYGSVKDNKATFGDLGEFIKWRTALMELSVIELDLASATIAIPADGVDPYKMVQVHDYTNVSFFRMDPDVKAASSETIKTFAMAYPELLKEKFFVNVPRLMGWVFAAMKLFLAPETVKKFHLLASGSSLAGECTGWGDELPETYGGNGADASSGMTPKYTSLLESPAAGEEGK